MIYLHVEDSYFYDKENNYKLLIEKISFSNKELSESIKEKEIVAIYDKESLVDLLKKGSFKKAIISPFEPSTFNMATSFFGVYKVENSEGILTLSEKEVGLKPYKKLNDALGLTVEESSLNFTDGNQDERLVEVARLLSLKLMLGEIPDAVFLAGIMGTGKSYFAQCLAGETSRLLVSFNLAKIMNDPNPVDKFDKVVDYLATTESKYLLWIDEIDKIFNGSPESEHIKNKFLTFLNDLGTTIDIDTLVVMTANNVTDIFTKFPEMVRAGRVEPFGKIFLDLLDIDSARGTAKLYINKRNSMASKKNSLANILITLNEKSDSILLNSLDKYDFYKPIAPKLELIYQLDVDTKKYRLTKKEKATLFSNKIEEIFSEDELERIYYYLHLDVDADRIVQLIDRMYRSIHQSTKINVFAYVHAEMKEVISQLYLMNIERKFNDSDNNYLDSAIEKIIKNNIAIADAGSDAVDKMKGNEDKFSIIIPRKKYSDA